jgi:tyrosine-protein kinase Etk/Wzc
MNKIEGVNEHYREEDEKPIDLRDLLYKFLRRKNIFMYIAIPIFLGIVISQFTKPYNPIYRAAFDIGVSQEKPAEGFLSPFSEVSAMQIGTATQRVISSLLSVNLANKIVDTLGLYAYIKNGNHHIEVEAKILTDFEKTTGPLKLKIRDGRFEIFDNGKKIKEGELNKFVDCDSFELKVIPLKKFSGKKTYELTIYPRNKMALALRNSLSIKVLEADKIDKGVGSSEVPFSGEGASKKLVTANPRVYDTNIGILRISIHWGNPDDALRIAQVLSTQMIEEDKREKSLQYVQSDSFIALQLQVYQEKLEILEEDIKSFKEVKRIANLDASTRALITQISQLESQKSQKKIEQKILKDLGEYLVASKQELNEMPNFASAMVSDPVLQNFYSQLLQVEAELKGRLKEYSKGHPRVLEIKARLAGLKDQMKLEIAKRIPTMRTEIRSIDNQIYSLQAKLETVPEDEMQLARLERDRETAEELYTFFAEKLEETRVHEAGVTSDLRIINPPLVSHSPVNSRGRFKSSIIALLLSILAGGFAVFIAEYFDNTIKDPDIVSKKIGLPIFASIPLVDSKEAEGKAQSDKGKSTATIPSPLMREGKGEAVSSLISKIVGQGFSLAKKGQISLANTAKNIFKPEKPVKKFRILDGDISSAEFEAFRKLSINLDFAHPEKKYKIIYITSAGPEEGKTFISANLGHVLSVANKKVIILDTDFRKKRGNLTYLTKSSKKKGLFDILKGETNLINTIIPLTIPISEGNNALRPSPDALRPTPDAQNNAQRPTPIALRLIPTGKIPPNPFVFLESEEMRNIITELKTDYDYVIIDGVPLLLFSDATYIANFVDGVLLTAKYGKTGFKELEYARDMLLTSNSNIIGLIMNAVPKTRSSSYYYHHYYYHKYYPKYYRKEQ